MTKGQAAYREFLETDFWQSLSLAARARDKRCVKCKSKDRLQAHHKRYPDNWFDTTLEDLETLCRKCHAKKHGFTVVTDWNTFIFPYREDPQFNAFVHRCSWLMKKVYSGRELRERDKKFLKLAVKMYPPTKTDTCMRFRVSLVKMAQKFIREHPNDPMMSYSRECLFK